jgi:hypothetical protein
LGIAGIARDRATSPTSEKPGIHHGGTEEHGEQPECQNRKNKTFETQRNGESGGDWVIAGATRPTSERQRHEPQRAPGTREARECRGSPMKSKASNRNMDSRNMDRQPIVLKDYEIPSYFARQVRYNEHALVYSGLLADRRSSAAFAGGKAAPRLKDRTQ